MDESNDYSEQAPCYDIVYGSTRQGKHPDPGTQHILLGKEACKHRKCCDRHRRSNEKHERNEVCVLPGQARIEEETQQSSYKQWEENRAYRCHYCCTALAKHEVRVQTRT